MTAMRLALGAGIGMVVAAVGAVLFEALGIGGWAWYGLASVAILCGMLADRERFFGISKTGSLRH
jgi:hypothetical protein